MKYELNAKALHYGAVLFAALLFSSKLFSQPAATDVSKSSLQIENITSGDFDIPVDLKATFEKKYLNKATYDLYYKAENRFRKESSTYPRKLFRLHRDYTSIDDSLNEGWILYRSNRVIETQTEKILVPALHPNCTYTYKIIITENTPIDQEKVDALAVSYATKLVAIENQRSVINSSFTNLDNWLSTELNSLTGENQVTASSVKESLDRLDQLIVETNNNSIIAQDNLFGIDGEIYNFWAPLLSEKQKLEKLLKDTSQVNIKFKKSSVPGFNNPSFTYQVLLEWTLSPSVPISYMYALNYKNDGSEIAPMLPNYLNDKLTKLLLNRLEESTPSNPDLRTSYNPGEIFLLESGIAKIFKAANISDKTLTEWQFNRENLLQQREDYNKYTKALTESIAAATVEFPKIIRTLIPISTSINMAQSIETRNTTYFGIDAGLQFALNNKVLYTTQTINYHFLPVNRSALFEHQRGGKGARQYFTNYVAAIYAGLAQDVTKTEKIDGLVSLGSLTCGASLRFTRILRFNAGVIFSRSIGENPISNRKRLIASPSLGLSVDIKLSNLFSEFKKK